MPAADPAAPPADAAPDAPPPPPKRKPKKKKTFVPLPAVAASSAWLPFTLAFTARLGRHAVAARALPAGSLVLVERAVAVVARARHAGSACPGCAAGVCGGGGKYCGAECGARHAPVAAAAAAGRAAALAAGAAHGAPASSPDGLSSEDLGDLLALVCELDAARAVEEGVCVRAGAAAPPAADACGHDHAAPPCDDNGADATTHWPLRCGAGDVAALASGWGRRSPAWRAQLTAAAAAAAAAVEAAAPYPPPSPSSLAILADVVATNAHGTGANDPSAADLGFGLFPALAMLNHSCAPNAAFAVSGGVARCRTTRDVAAGEELTVGGGGETEGGWGLRPRSPSFAHRPTTTLSLLQVPYINLYEPRRTRAAQLAESKHFICACARCVGPLASARDRHLEAVPCRARGCGGSLLPACEAAAPAAGAGEWECDSCGARVPASTPDKRGPANVVAAAEAALAAAMATLHTKGSAAAAPALAAVAGLAPATLHPHHVLVFDSLMPLANGLRKAGDVAGAAKAVALLIAAMDALVGVPTAELGNLLEYLADLLAERAARSPAALATRLARGARDAAARGADTRSLVLGPNHPLAAASRDQVARLRAL
jgi:hypothetical protein